MKLRMYVLTKQLPNAIGESTTVFFNGWELINNNMQPKWGSPYLDGIRLATLFSNTKMIDEILAKLPDEFKKDSIIADVLIQPV